MPDLQSISLIIGILIGAYTLLTALIALIASYFMVKYRLNKLEEDKVELEQSIEKMRTEITAALKEVEKFFKGVLFQPDGQTTLMPRSACGEARESCQNTMQKGFNDLAEKLVDFDKKREDSKSALLGLFSKLNKSLMRIEAREEAAEKKGGANGNNRK